MRNALLLAGLTLVLLSGCDGREVTTSSDNIKEMCIDGVTYIAFKESHGYNGYGYLSVKLNRESKVVECTSTDY